MKHRTRKLRICPECHRPFRNWACRQVTCGTDSCLLSHYHKKQRESNERFKTARLGVALASLSNKLESLHKKDSQ
jgi:hypothetical protein